MKDIFEIARHNTLFQSIALSDFEKMLTCLSARTVSYDKDQVIMLSGETITSVGLVLSGSVIIIKEDVEGRIVILSEHTVAEVFGEVFACAGITQSPVTIQAAEDSEILFLDYKRIITTCTAACPYHTMLIQNMLKLVAVNNLNLSQKIDILSKRTTREKLMSYFDLQRGVSKKFTIPFNREELANYLCVDRSAMSNELGKMRSEGLVRFSKNEFEIL